jgi:hypothetical protein
MKTGRPVEKSGSAAKKHRTKAREWYQRQSPSKKSSLVASRDKEAQRKADAKRHSKSRSERNAYHSAQQKAVAGKKNPGKCARCGSTTNVELHHKGGRVTALCAKCHAKARGYV